MNKVMDIRVAQILEEDKIVINKGFDDGIQEYMEFLVYSEGEEIFDPISKESLGKLENPKGVFKPMHTQNKMTILISKIARQKNPFAQVLLNYQIDAERDIMKSIKVGDKVKVINQL